MIATTERTLAEHWCGIAAKKRKPIFFLFIVMDYPDRRKSSLSITQRPDRSFTLLSPISIDRFHSWVP
jgi:hypothetical protein